MSERRNNRIVDGSLSGYPYFCIKNPGLNSGLMIPQYVQAGLLNEMRMLATPSTIDNTPTCGNQEDYVAMGYNACKKSGPMAEKLEYMLAIELLSVYEVQQFVDPDVSRAPATAAVLAEIGKTVPAGKGGPAVLPARPIGLLGLDCPASLPVPQVGILPLRQNMNPAGIL